MTPKAILPFAVAVPIGLALLIGPGLSTEKQGNAQAQASRKALSENDRQISAYAQRMIEQGRQIFRFDSFGSEAFWGDSG